MCCRFLGIRAAHLVATSAHLLLCAVLFESWLLLVAALPGELRLLGLLLITSGQLLAVAVPLKLPHAWDSLASGSQRFLGPVCVWLLLAAVHARIARTYHWQPFLAAFCFAFGYAGWAFDEVKVLSTE